MFERFTERSRDVATRASEIAREFKHNYVGDEHLLVALAEQEGSPVAALVLTRLGVDGQDVRDFITRIVGKGDTETDAPPFTPRAKKLFEKALREALSMGHNYIGTEHLLLALVCFDEGVAHRYLLEHEISGEQVRNEIVQMLTGESSEVAAFKEAAMERMKRPGLLTRENLSEITDGLMKFGGYAEATTRQAQARGGWTFSCHLRGPYTPAELREIADLLEGYKATITGMTLTVS